MGEIRHFTVELSFSSISVAVSRIGEDYSLMVCGGGKPHIGCTVLAEPRESLTGDGHMSCTSSVLNLSGHKDEQICRLLAEETAKKHGVVVVCSGGFHLDDITEDQIAEVLAATQHLSELI